MLFVFTPKTPAAMRGLASAALFLCVCCAAAAAPLDAPEEQPGLFEGDIIEVKVRIRDCKNLETEVKYKIAKINSFLTLLKIFFFFTKR